MHFQRFSSHTHTSTLNNRLWTDFSHNFQSLPFFLALAVQFPYTRMCTSVSCRLCMTPKTWAQKSTMHSRSINCLVHMWIKFSGQVPVCYLSKQHFSLQIKIVRQSHVYDPDFHDVCVCLCWIQQWCIYLWAILTMFPFEIIWSDRMVGRIQEQQANFSNIVMFQSICAIVSDIRTLSIINDAFYRNLFIVLAQWLKPNILIWFDLKWLPLCRILSVE